MTATNTAGKIRCSPGTAKPPARNIRNAWGCSTASDDLNTCVTTSSKKAKPDNDDDDDDDDYDDGGIGYGGGDGGEKVGNAASSIGNRRRPFLPRLRSIASSSSAASPLLSSAIPGIARICLRSALFATVTLYVLNQKHLLPRPIGAFASKLLFWPTLPITISQRIGKWTTQVDDAVVLGGAPFGFLNYPERLMKQYNVRAVINMCEEYNGPQSQYRKLGIEHLHLPTVDHFEPSVDDLKRAVSFVQKHEEKGGKVYIHCRAGHGRSAAAVYAWLLYKEPLADPEDLNEKLCGLRKVRKTLWKQPNVCEFREWLQGGGDVDDVAENVRKPVRQRKKREAADIIRPEKVARGRDEWDDEDDSDDEGFAGSSYSTESDSSYWESSTEERYRASLPKGRNGRGNNGRGDDVEELSVGPVFSDEYDTTDSYYGDESFTSSEEMYDGGYSEDEKDYQMWKNYQDRNR